MCKLVFATYSDLEAHTAASERQNRCCQCSKRFAHRTKFDCHRRKHSKEKPFQCSGCGKNYAHRATLSRHQQHYCQTLREKCREDSDVLFASPLLLEDLNRMREDEEVKSDLLPSLPKSSPALTAGECSPTQCRVCKLEFGDPASLANHSERHLDLRTCCLCSRVLGNRSKLLTHHRSHTKEAPYACPFCDKRFGEASTLRKHEATHGAKNFQCPLCDKGFVRKDYLSKHVLTHRQTFRCAQCSFVCHERADIERHVAEGHPAAAVAVAAIAQ